VQLSGSSAARLALAEALYATGEAGQAEQLLLDLQAEAATPEARGQIAVIRGSNLISGFGRAAEAEELVRAAARSLDGGELRDELVALGGMLALTRGRSRQALDEVEPILARPGPSGAATMRALLVAMSAWGQVGRAETAVAVGHRLRDDAPDHELPTVMEVALVGLCYAYGVLGRLDEAEALARGRYDASLDQRAPDLRSLWALALGQAALSRGDLAAADGALREAALLLRHDQSVLGVYSLAWCLGCLAEVLAAGGDAAGGRAVLDEADAVTPEPCFIATRELARIWVTWAEQSSSAAAGVALEVARASAERGLLVPEVFALHQAARLGHAEQVADRLAELAGLADGELVTAHAAHAEAVHRGDADLLLAASRTYERLGVRLDAAEAAARAAGSFARAGQASNATAAAQRSAALAARCPGAATPALVLAVSPQALTAREQEVAGLAARGWTTAQIAEALVVSVRTVDNHLHRAYGKLGITSRHELARLMPLAAAGRPAGR
jgi:ATP/maltotriose-dependent transcriptional regulator MalT